jgi:hypothetical protein
MKKYSGSKPGSAENALFATRTRKNGGKNHFPPFGLNLL